MIIIDHMYIEIFIPLLNTAIIDNLIKISFRQHTQYCTCYATTHPTKASNSIVVYQGKAKNKPIVKKAILTVDTSKDKKFTISTPKYEKMLRYLYCNKQKGKVAKLCYAVRGPYQIIRTTGHGSYFVGKLHRPDSPELKFMVYDLYPLPSSLKPCELVNTIDTMYLNQSHTPITNPLKKKFYIELYNEKWFDKPLHTSIPPFRYHHRTLDISTKSVSPFPIVVELHNDTNTFPPTSSVEAINDTLSLPLSPLILHASLDKIDCLFSFIIFLQTLLNPVGSLSK